jgi:hypothetical protein
LGNDEAENTLKEREMNLENKKIHAEGQQYCLFGQWTGHTLEGGLGVFNCKNNRKYYKKHSALGNKYAGYRHKLCSKWLNIYQTANSMKEVSL